MTFTFSLYSKEVEEDMASFYLKGGVDDSIFISLTSPTQQVPVIVSQFADNSFNQTYSLTVYGSELRFALNPASGDRYKYGVTVMVLTQF